MIPNRITSSSSSASSSSTAPFLKQPGCFVFETVGVFFAGFWHKYSKVKVIKLVEVRPAGDKLQSIIEYKFSIYIE